MHNDKFNNCEKCETVILSNEGPKAPARVDDMTVSHDGQLKSVHVTTYIGHVAPLQWIRFHRNASRSRYLCEIVALIKPYKV